MPTLDATPAPPNCRLLLVVGIIEKVGMFLVHVHADIFCASHKRVFLSGWFEASTQTLLQKGRPFILRPADSNGRTQRFFNRLIP